MEQKSKLILLKNVSGIYDFIFDKPGVAGAVLHTALWLTHQLTHWSFVKISLK